MSEGADERVAVVGSGSIGVSWAIVFARAGHTVAISDPDPARQEAARGELRTSLTDLAKAGLLDEPPGTVAARVTPRPLEQAVAGAVHVQECAPETLEVKRELFRWLDEVAQPGVPLASSSSAITASAFADGLGGRARCLVAHPVNPPHLLPVVEVVPAPFTEPAATAAVTSLLEGAGMSPVYIRRELEGFVLNRLQAALLREAYRLVADGVASSDDIDRVVRDGLGRRWAFSGPFETADLNTRGGIGAHARLLGPAYGRMAAERGEDDPWRTPVIEQVEAERRKRLPLDEWEARVAWRERALMMLERVRRELTVEVS